MAGKGGEPPGRRRRQVTFVPLTLPGVRIVLTSSVAFIVIVHHVYHEIGLLYLRFRGLLEGRVTSMMYLNRIIRKRRYFSTSATFKARGLQLPSFPG